MNPLITYLLYGVVGGPALALSYGLGEFTPLFCFLTLSLMYVLSVVVINFVLSAVGLEHRFRNKVFSRVNRMVSERGLELAVKVDDAVSKFRREFGEWGLHLALTTFTLLFGVYWAGLVAYILKVELLSAVFSIGSGAVISVAFWTYLITSRNIDPMIVTAFFMALTVVLMLYGLARENKTFRSVTRKIVSELGKRIEV